MSDLVEKQFRFLRPDELIKDGDEWNTKDSNNDWKYSWRSSIHTGKCAYILKNNTYRRQVGVKHYRYLEVGECIKEGDEYYNTGKWWNVSNNGVHVMHRKYYRRLISESKPDEETYVPISTNRRETSTDSSSIQSNRDRHITIDKSNYRWDGSIDLTKQHCISVSVEEV